MVKPAPTSRSGMSWAESSSSTRGCRIVYPARTRPLAGDPEDRLHERPPIRVHLDGHGRLGRGRLQAQQRLRLQPSGVRDLGHSARKGLAAALGVPVGDHREAPHLGQVIAEDRIVVLAGRGLERRRLERRLLDGRRRGLRKEGGLAAGQEQRQGREGQGEGVHGRGSGAGGRPAERQRSDRPPAAPPPRRAYLPSQPDAPRAPRSLGLRQNLELSIDARIRGPQRPPGSRTVSQQGHESPQQTTGSGALSH